MMPWIELSLDATHEAVDWIYTLLGTINFTGEIRVTNYALDRSPSEGWAFTLYLYLPNDLQARRQIDTIADLFAPLHRTGLTTALEIAVLEVLPMREASLTYKIGQRFVVLSPDAVDRSQPHEIPLRIETGLSFGSGFHPATRVCLQLLERYVLPGMQTLDLGSGSGILSVAMAKLGAQVLALDNDEMAVRSTQATVHLNGVAQQVTVKAGSLGLGSDLGHWMNGNTRDAVPTIDAQNSFDLLVANVFARVQIALAPDFRWALRRTPSHTGILITAGFTVDREEDVDQALLTAGFEAIDCKRLNEWVALAHRLKQ